MGSITLSPEDRGKYGAPERIPFQYGRWGLRVVNALESQVVEVPVGEDKPRGWTVEDLYNAMRRKKVRNGEVVQEPVVDDDGEPVLDEGGNPKMREVTEPSALALAVVVWLALWSNGVRVPWDSFDVDPWGLRIDWANEEETGKAQTPEE